jgi:antitoxin CptB
MQTALQADALVDERALSKLRWRCRRGLLENDLFVERFFVRHAATLTERQSQGLQVLMDLSDNDLLDLLLARTRPQGELLRDDVLEVLRLMRARSDNESCQGAAFQNLPPAFPRNEHDPV